MKLEKQFFNFDIHELRSWLERDVFSLPPLMESKSWGGWSVTSASGKYIDGWAYFPSLFNNDFDLGRILRLAKTVAGRVKDADHVKPTEICRGYVVDVIKKIDESGFQPTRVRVALLKSNGAIRAHSDGASDGSPKIRLHIPVITNAMCFFESDGERIHMPADGEVYLVNVNLPHRAFNGGATDRYHIIMDVRDPKGSRRWRENQQGIPG